MIFFLNEFSVDADIEKVWKFYTDIDHLKVITPSRFKLEINQTNGKKIENKKEVCISGNIFPILRSTWYSKITFFDPINYVYIDEMIKGPFKKWVHTHKFVSVNQNVTKVIDQINFQLSIETFDYLISSYAKNSLKKLFKNREEKTRKFFA